MVSLCPSLLRLSLSLFIVDKYIDNRNNAYQYSLHFAPIDVVDLTNNACKFYLFSIVAMCIVG